VVDADQRHPERRQLARDAEHGAVAAEHDGDVGLLADRVHGVARALVRADVLGRGEVEHHLAAGALDDAGDLEQRLADAFRARLPEDGDVGERLGHADDYAGTLLPRPCRSRDSAAGARLRS
jgi:hypothetical protein